MIKDRILNEKDITQEEIDQFGQEVRNDFMKSNKKFIEILKDELKNLPIKVKVNIKNKQKSLAMMTDKMTNVIRFVFSTYNPQTQTFAVLQDPQMAKLFNQILEYSGLSPIDYGANSTQPITQPQQPQMPNEMPAMAQQMVQQNAV